MIAVMGVEKMSVSFDLQLGEAIRTSAAATSQSVSAWLSEAARARLRNEALGEAVAAWEHQFGPLGEAEVEAAQQVLDRTSKRRARPAGSLPRQ